MPTQRMLRCTNFCIIGACIIFFPLIDGRVFFLMCWYVFWIFFVCECSYGPLVNFSSNFDVIFLKFCVH